MKPDSRDPKLPLVIGVAGHRHLPDGEPREAIENNVTLIFRALSAEHAPDPGPDTAEDDDKTAIRALRRRLGFPAEMIDHGIPTTIPIWILCPMAQGADILSALKAREVYKRENRECRFIAPLAGPWKLRRKEEPQVEDTWNANHEDFTRLRGLAIADNDGLVSSPYYEEFVLPLNGRGVLQKETNFPSCPLGNNLPHLTWAEQEVDEMDALLDGLDDGESSHHRALSHYVALYSHLLLVIWDGELRENSVGTDAAVTAKIDGPSAGQISETALFDWADAGPVIQVLCSNHREPDSESKPKDEPAPILPDQWPDVLREGEKVIRDFLDEDADGPAEDGSVYGLKDRKKRVAAIGDYTVLHPNDCRLAEGDPQLAEAAEALPHGTDPEEVAVSLRNRKGRGLFRHILKAMDGFNREQILPAERDHYFLPAVDTDANLEKPEELRPGFAIEAGQEDEKLRAIWRKGALVSEKSNRLKKTTLRHFSMLFLLVVVAAVTFDLYAHWYAGFEDGKPKHYPWILAAFLGISFGAVALFWKLLQCTRSEGRFLELRALAEAARIQLAWMIAGIPQSVALHYLQRHRGAFDYIRDTVSAWCFPYEAAQRRFDKLPGEQRIRRLRYLRENWVRDQENFFQINAPHERAMHHTLHIVGVATALIGVSGATFLLALEAEGPVKAPLGTLLSAAALMAGIFFTRKALRRLLPASHEEHDDVAEAGRSARPIWPLVVAALLAPPLSGWLLPAGKMNAAHPGEHWPVPVAWIIYLATAGFFVAFVFDRLRTDSAKMPGGIRRKLLRRLPFFPFYASAACFLLLAGTAIFDTWHSTDHHAEIAHPAPAAAGAESLEATGEGNPHHDSHEGAIFPWILVIGVPLLLGALLVAWGEKQLHSEHANRYASARELFRLTGRRLDRILEEAEEAWKRIASAASGMPAEEDVIEFHRQIDAARTSLYQLGKEALSENAEWLLQHRTRPLDFPMAG